MVQQLSTLRMLKNKNVNIGVGRCLVINHLKWSTYCQRSLWTTPWQWSCCVRTESALILNFIKLALVGCTYSWGGLGSRASKSRATKIRSKAFSIYVQLMKNVWCYYNPMSRHDARISNEYRLCELQHLASKLEHNETKDFMQWNLNFHLTLKLRWIISRFRVC